jgi:DhnA family fructose-bisphosphate aldolase class Ia
MNEIIRLFSAGFIRHTLHKNGVLSSVKREYSENIDLIVKTNERNIGVRNVRRISIVQREM